LQAHALALVAAAGEAAKAGHCEQLLFATAALKKLRAHAPHAAARGSKPGTQWQAAAESDAVAAVSACAWHGVHAPSPCKAL